MMDVSCDACSKRYRIDETRMKSDSAKVKCKACGHLFSVVRPQAADLVESIFETGTLTAPAAAPTRSSRTAPSGPQDPAATLRASETFTAPPTPEEKPYQPAAGMVKPRFGLFSKTIIVMLLISILPFGVFWFITFRETSARIRSDSEALMAQTAKGLADQVDSWITGNFTMLRTAAKLPDILSMNRDRQEPILKAIGREYPWMYLVFTVDPNGMNVARNDGEPLVSYADRQYVKDVLAGKAMSWQTVIGRTSNVPALVIAVPIKEENRVIGVMAAAMTVDDLSKHIASWKKGQTGFAFLVDEKGFVISHPSRQMVQKRENLNSQPLLAEFRKKGWTTLTTSFTDEAGQPALGHVRSTPFGWVLALQQEEHEMFDSLTLIQNFALALLAITALLAAVIAWFSARSLVTPIMKLTDAAERMSLGDLNVKIDVSSRDEIGLLAQAIARMQTSLRMAMERLRKKR
ncbi:MAG: cache domain-containing protein [Hyphomicrobiales bacterium]